MGIAGHTFEQTPSGRRCTAYSSAKEGTCNAAWVEVRAATEADIEGSLGIAHAGKLTRTEYAEIVQERLAEETKVWDAVVYAASAGSR